MALDDETITVHREAFRRRHPADLARTRAYHAAQVAFAEAWLADSRAMLDLVDAELQLRADGEAAELTSSGLVVMEAGAA